MSRLWAKVWIVVAAICVGLTVYEIPDAKLIWRFAWATLRRHRHTVSGELDVPAIMTDELIAADPEASDMLRYCLEYSRENPNLEELAALAEKYPENEFFPAQLAEELTRETVVDPQAVLILVDRLLKLNPENGHYRYLRGGILLTDPNGSDRVQRALEPFELGHRLPQFYLPHSPYKERLERLCKKANLTWERPMTWPLYGNLATYSFRSRGSYRRIGDDALGDVSASVVKIASRTIESADDFHTLATGAGLLGATESIRLAELDLSEGEAQQSRLRLIQAMVLSGVHMRLLSDTIPPLMNLIWMLFLVPIMLTSAAVSLWAILLGGVQSWLRRREPKVRTIFKACMLIDAGLIVILVVLVFLTIVRKRPAGQLPTALVLTSALFILWAAVGLYDIHPDKLACLRRPHLWLAFLCGSLWFKGTIFWTAGTLGVSTPDNVSGWLQYGIVLLGWFVFCALVWAQVVYQPEAFTAKRRHGVVLIMEWAVLLMVVHIFGSLQAQANRFFVDPLARYRPHPGATQETYRRMVLGAGPLASPPEEGSFAGIPRHFEFAAPDDVGTFIARRQAAGQSIPEKGLRWLLTRCGRDVRPIILNALADPNADEVLIIRGSWGDRAVKDQLVRIFEERLAVFSDSEPEPPRRGPSSLGELLDLAGTLAWISDGPEGQDRLSYLLEYVVERTRDLGVGPSLTDPRHAERIMLPFWEALGKLPAGYATELVKSYLRQTRYVDLFGDRGRDIGQLAALLADGDRELAEEVVAALAQSLVAPEPPEASDAESAYTHNMSLARYRWKNSPYCLEAVFAHLNAESIPLLLEYLNSDNDQLRACLVWRLTSLGYEFPSDRLHVLQKDIDWKVRLNTLFACGADDLIKALDDESAVVRIVARMLKSE